MFESLNKLIDRLFHRRTSRAVRGRHVGRGKTRDDAFKFRMGAGFPGDINRWSPAVIEPCLIDANAPPTAYGQGVVVDPTTQGVRPLVAGDSGLTAVHGFTVRPFPLQSPSAPNNFGGTQTGGGAITSSGTPPSTGVIDVLKSGYVIAKWSGVGSAPVKGGAVDIWVAANSGNHVQGVTVETSHTGGSSITLATAGSGAGSTYFNGGPDANNNVEIAFNL